MQLMQDPLPFGRRNDECFTLQDQAIINSESLSVLPVWVEGMRNILDVLRPASKDEVGKGAHFWIIDKDLLESFYVVWHYVGMMDSNIQWKVRDWIERACLVWPFPCLGGNGLWGHIPVGIASCVGAMQACLLTPSWRWIQVAYGLTQFWRTIHRCKCRISLL